MVEGILLLALFGSRTVQYWHHSRWCALDGRDGGDFLAYNQQFWAALACILFGGLPTHINGDVTQTLISQVLDYSIAFEGGEPGLIASQAHPH